MDAPEDSLKPGDRVWHDRLRKYGTVDAIRGGYGTTYVTFDGEYDSSEVSTDRLVRSTGR